MHHEHRVSRCYHIFIGDGAVLYLGTRGSKSFAILIYDHKKMMIDDTDGKPYRLINHFSFERLK
jgi:hypothetical protein